jgi:hypothetical protein
MTDVQAPTDAPARLAVPSYDWIVDTYNLKILKEPGDFSIEEGDLATTKDGDIKIGSNVYNALFRLVQAWRFHYPHLRTLFDLAVTMTSEKARLTAAIDEMAPALMTKFDSASQRSEHLAPIHDAFEEQDAAELGHDIYSSCVILVIDATLRRFKDDIDAKETEWNGAAPLFNEVSLPIRLTQTPTRASVCPSWRLWTFTSATIWLSPNRSLSFSSCFPMTRRALPILGAPAGLTALSARIAA